MSSDLPYHPSRRSALKCLAFGAARTPFVLAGRVHTAVEPTLAASSKGTSTASSMPLSLPISDMHIGVSKAVNPDVAGTLKQTIYLVNAIPVKPALTLATSDITHLSRPAEFKLRAHLLSGLNITGLHIVPGEHDRTEGPGTEYFERFDHASDDKGYCSFDQCGVDFMGSPRRCISKSMARAMRRIGTDQEAANGYREQRASGPRRT